MSMPPTVGPNVALVLQRLDLIERKIDWLAERRPRLAPPRPSEGGGAGWVGREPRLIGR